MPGPRALEVDNALKGNVAARIFSLAERAVRSQSLLSTDHRRWHPEVIYRGLQAKSKNRSPSFPVSVRETSRTARILLSCLAAWHARPVSARLHQHNQGRIEGLQTSSSIIVAVRWLEGWPGKSVLFSCRCGGARFFLSLLLSLQGRVYLLLSFRGRVLSSAVVAGARFLLPCRVRFLLSLRCRGSCSSVPRYSAWP